MILEAAVASTKIDAFTPQPAAANKTDQIIESRKKQDAAKKEEAKPAEEKDIQPEEILEQIKALTEDGLYSVRFERNEDLADVVMQIFDQKSQEIIRQIPAEELIKFRSSFRELIGNLIDTKV